MISQWDDYRNTYWLPKIGEHICIHDCSWNCTASGTRDGNNPWDTDCSAVVSTDNGNASYDGIAETCMHEAGHGFCRSTLCGFVDNMIDDNEHDLGIIRSEGSDDLETPLGSPGAADRGDCDTKSSSNPDGYTHKLSDCEADGYKYTADHVAGNHNSSPP